MSKWGRKDTQDSDQKQHGVRTSGEEVSEAWHQARDDAERSGDLQRGSPSGSQGRSGSSGSSNGEGGKSDSGSSGSGKK